MPDNTIAVQESYIVRIYRRNRRTPAQAVGTVEQVGTSEKIAFHSLDDLIEFLHLSRRRSGMDVTKER